jgi:hypothetical protein
MKARSTRLAVEPLEDRCVPSAVAYADFNKDGLMDMAALTNPTTITVSLANPDGSYTVSDTLSLPKSQPTNGVNVGDYDYDGDLDIGASSFSKTGTWYTHVWLGNGDGSFGHRDSHKASFEGW